MDHTVITRKKNFKNKRHFLQKRKQNISISVDCKRKKKREIVQKCWRILKAELKCKFTQFLYTNIPHFSGKND